jgi:hypothetical protein
VSEHEKRLREYLRQVAPLSYDMEDGGGALLNALLAEHRAEAGQCHAALDTAGVVRERSSEPGVRRPLLERVAILADERNRAEERASSARNAALEEAAGVCDQEESDLREPGGDEAAAETVSGLAARIRALKAAPASVLPTAKAREVLREIRDAAAKDRDSGMMADSDHGEACGRWNAATAAAESLGLSLDEEFTQQQWTYNDKTGGDPGARIAARREEGMCEHNSMRPHVYTSPPESLRGRPRCLYCDTEKPA